MLELLDVLRDDDRGHAGLAIIADEVKKSGIQEGLCLVNAMHITASVFINDDEPGLHADYKRWLEKLAPFDRGAVAMLIEHGARIAGRNDRLTSRFGRLADVAREASFVAVKSGERHVSAESVREAVRRFTGAYAIVVFDAQAPDRFVVARIASPLVIGLGFGANFVASDVSALLPVALLIVLSGSPPLVETDCPR